MTARLLLLGVCFLATAGYSARAVQPERVPLREPLNRFSTELGRWTGRDLPKMSDDVVAVLGADDYLNRIYRAASEPPVSLYIGYYQSQREGDTIHSPLNCLPGAGWLPVVTERKQVTVAGRSSPIVVNWFVIEKGTDRQVVLYWYQSHGRVIASEYWSKVYLVHDALRWNRSDAAMVRVITPIASADAASPAAEQRVREFVEVMFPHLERFLPS